MPRERDVPFGLRQPQLLKAHSRQSHQGRRARNERDAKPGTDERYHGEQFKSLLHDARREAGRRADAQHVVVEARGPGTRDDDEWFGRNRQQADASVPPAVWPERCDEMFGQDVARP